MRFALFCGFNSYWICSIAQKKDFKIIDIAYRINALFLL